MENRKVKFFSKESNMVAIRAIQGHFATSHSHINYYIDVTSLKARANEAKEVAKILKSKIVMPEYVDTIVCMDGTQVIGAYLADEFEKANVLSTNTHDTIYVISPEEEHSAQMIFRDNIRLAIEGKHIVVLLATTTTGETIRKSLECIRYYGGIIESVASIFSTVDSVDGMPVEHVFNGDDLPGYATYKTADCPYCKMGQKIEAMVNGFGYSKL